MWEKVAVARFIHSTMKWQPMPASAREPSGTRVEVLCGQPGQKYGVRAIGITGEAERSLASMIASRSRMRAEVK